MSATESPEPVADQSRALVRLAFDYDASLIVAEQPLNFRGSIEHDWIPCWVLTSPSQAAWAHVRGLLEHSGVWHCTVKVKGELAETRIIDVDVTDQGIFRMDRSI